MVKCKIIRERKLTLQLLLKVFSDCEPDCDGDGLQQDPLSSSCLICTFRSLAIMLLSGPPSAIIDTLQMIRELLTI